MQWTRKHLFDIGSIRGWNGLLIDSADGIVLAPTDRVVERVERTHAHTLRHWHTCDIGSRTPNHRSYHLSDPLIALTLEAVVSVDDASNVNTCRNLQVCRWTEILITVLEIRKLLAAILTLQIRCYLALVATWINLVYWICYRYLLGHVAQLIYQSLKIGIVCIITELTDIH